MYWESWDFSGFGPAYRTIIDKIYYLRWGHPGDDLYILAGALPSVTLGQGILVNNFGGIMRCDVIAEGVVTAAEEVELNVPLVVRLEGTNVEKGKKIMADSGLPIMSADNLGDAAKKVVAAVKESR